MENLSFLKGRNLFLRPLLERDLNLNYVSWLNDPQVNEFSRRSLLPTNEIEAKKYISTLDSNDIVLAICLKNGKHVGNIKFGPIDWVNRSAEISILIGEKNEWGKGYGSEAIYLISKHLFQKLNLVRIEAGTINPAFSRAVEKLGWKKEGVLRKAFFINGEYKDIIRLSILQEEFNNISHFEDNFKENYLKENNLEGEVENKYEDNNDYNIGV